MAASSVLLERSDARKVISCLWTLSSIAKTEEQVQVKVIANWILNNLQLAFLSWR
jgi:hypothetical protein